jgi:8-amino-7-oxononanoate synthase
MYVCMMGPSLTTLIRFQAASSLHTLSNYLLSQLDLCLQGVPPTVLGLPPHLAGRSETEHPVVIIPLLTAHARLLRAFLSTRGFVGADVCHPIVPKGMDRVRMCLHASNTYEEVDRLVATCKDWIAGLMTISDSEVCSHRESGVQAKL